MNCEHYFGRTVKSAEGIPYDYEEGCMRGGDVKDCSEQCPMYRPFGSRHYDVITDDWEAAKGRRFRPTFKSDIRYFTIRGYDAERKMVLTTATMEDLDAADFDTEIEEDALLNAFNIGEYEVIKEIWEQEGAMQIFSHMPTFEPKLIPVRFDGPCCGRCQHRWATTSNRHWCEEHYHSQRCYRFKLEK